MIVLLGAARSSSTSRPTPESRRDAGRAAITPDDALDHARSACTGNVPDMDAINAIAHAPARRRRGRRAELRRDLRGRRSLPSEHDSAAPASSRASRSAATATAAPSSPTMTIWTRACREFGSTDRAARTLHTPVGVGGRMDTLQCAIVLAKLERFEWELAQRRSRAERYLQLLRGCAGVALPTRRTDGESAWAQFTIQVERRAAIQAALQAQGGADCRALPAPGPSPACVRASGSACRLPTQRGGGGLRAQPADQRGPHRCTAGPGRRRGACSRQRAP
jgi:hypothetical protein